MRNGIARISAIVILILSLSLCACGGNKACKEECEDDDDCTSGLDCHDTNDGTICLPDECGECFSNSGACNYDTQTDEDGNLECSFTSCS